MKRDGFRDSYSWLAQCLHWATVALLLGQWWLSELATQATSDSKTLAFLALHKSFGITVLGLAILRLLYRLLSQQPAIVPMPSWQAKMARAVHGLLYLLIFLLPITGWLGSSAAAYSVSWFNWVQLPDLIPPSENLEEAFFSIHRWCWRLLCVLVVMHIAGALKHQLIDQDKTLAKMLSLPGALTLVAVFVLVVAVKTSITSQQLLGASEVEGPGEAGQVLKSGDHEAKQSRLIQSGLRPWSIDYDHSEIRFYATQAGAEFQGYFGDWQSKILLDPLRIKEGMIQTVVQLESVSTADEERDATLLERSFFAVGDFPVATFTMLDFTTQSHTEATVVGDDDGADESAERPVYSSLATLEIKGVRHQVPFRFTIDNDEQRKILMGTSLLNRLALGVGTGEWSDPTWIAAEVRVEVIVRTSAE